jgi:hypothetical protein
LAVRVFAINAHGVSRGRLRNLPMGFLISSEVIAAIVSAVATLIGGAAASGILETLSQYIRKRTRLTTDSAYQKELPPSSATPRTDKATSQVLIRLAEARTVKLTQERSARWSRWASNSLVFGQYVIGGAMATSFVQKTLSPTIIGVFGVLVVVASLVKQHYHPETNAQSALQRTSQLDTLIRQSEDRLVVIETKMQSGDDPALILELLEGISAEISRIKSSPVEPAMKTDVQKRKK